MSNIYTFFQVEAPASVNESLRQIADSLAALDLGSNSGGTGFPVDSIFISAVSTDPAILLGYGTWTSLGTGRVLVGVDVGDPDFDTVLETGGSKVHVHT